MKVGLALVLALTLPAAAQADCERTKGQPLATDDQLTLDYLICKHREQAEALQRQRVRRPPPQDESQIPDGAVDDLTRRTQPFAERARRTQDAVDAMGDVNIEMGDRLKMLQPRRIP